MIKGLDKRLTQSSEEERSAIEKEVGEYERFMELKATEESQQLQAEADLTTRLQTEEGKMTDVNGLLDSLLNESRGP